MDENYDVFLSYNRKDQDAVRQIAEALESYKLQVWFDEWEAVPGRSWKKLIQEALEHAKSTAVFIGPEGYGAWEEVEMDVALEEQVSRGCPVIPVLLPGAPADVKLPPFLRRNTWVKFNDRLDDAEGLYRLRWGITGEKPVDDEPAPATSPGPAPAASHQVDQAIDSLASALVAGNVTYFVGPWASQGGPHVSPSSHEIAFTLLERLQVVRAGDRLVPPLDLAGSYYAIWDGLNLETEIVNLISRRSRAVPPAHARLADLLKLLESRPPRRLRSRRRQLIVTTNLDLMMERALLCRGISFTRVVHHRSLPQLDVNHYRVRIEGRLLYLDGVPAPVALDDLDALDDAIVTCGRTSIGPQQSLPLFAPETSGPGGPERVPPPLLYKHHGSQDIENSCAISTEQYFELMRERTGKIPSEVLDPVRNTPLLFLGYSLLDPEFRLIFHTLLCERNKSLRHYGLRVMPQGEETATARAVESALWDRIKETGLTMGVTTLEEREDVFLGRLCRRLAGLLGAS